jgi:hypothetical protein
VTAPYLVGGQNGRAADIRNIELQQRRRRSAAAAAVALDLEE